MHVVKVEPYQSKQSMYEIGMNLKHILLAADWRFSENHIIHINRWHH